jgi:phosphatidylglycerol:prolipoprotein diacylglycerol transferase
VFPRLSDLVNYLFGTRLTFPGYTFGFVSILATGVAFYIGYLELKRRGNNGQIPVDSKKFILYFIGISVLSCLVGMKLFHILDHWDQFTSDPFMVLFPFKGLSYYGGLTFGCIAVIWYAHHKNISHPHALDMLALVNLIGYAIGRLGCQLSGDGCWGIPNTIPKPGWLSFLPDWAWGFSYPHNVVGDGIRMSDCAGKYCFILPGPVFPTPIYEAFLTLVAFIILWSIRKKITIPGWLFSIFLIIYSLMRFFIEFIRVNPKFSILWMTLSQAQYISILAFLTGIASFWYFRWLHRHGNSGQRILG